MVRFISMSIIVLLAVSVRQTAAAPATQPARGFDLREWAVFILDASQNTLNPQASVTSTLPSFVTTSREAADPPSHVASPVGIIRLIGDSDKPVDITIQGSAAGSFVSSWPQAVGSSRVDLQACKLEYSIVSPK